MLLPTSHACKLRYFSRRKGYRTRPPRRRLSTPRRITQRFRPHSSISSWMPCHSVNQNRVRRPYCVRHNVTSRQSSPVILLKYPRQPIQKTVLAQIALRWQLPIRARQVRNFSKSKTSESLKSGPLSAIGEFRICRNGRSLPTTAHARPHHMRHSPQNTVVLVLAEYQISIAKYLRGVSTHI